MADAADKLLLQAHRLEGGLRREDGGHRLLVALGASLMIWLQDLAPDGIDASLVEVAASDILVSEYWATRIRGLADDVVLLRDAMADEIDRAIAAALDAR